jgi:cation transport ATPase
VALQSTNIGIGQSLIAMMVAASGHLPPVRGALVQEIIDVGVVLNALRAFGGGPGMSTPDRRAIFHSAAIGV